VIFVKGTLVIYFGLDCITGKLFDPMGNVKLVLRHPVSLIMSGDNVEQDPEEWLEAVTSMLGKAQNAFGDIDVCELTMVYQPGTFVCIDRTGRHLMNAILPCDCRSRYQARNCQKMNYKHSESIGIPWGLMLLPRLLWIKYNRPDVYRDIYMVLTPDGYISYRLCGETAIDENSALFFGYNPKTNSYNGRIFNRLGIETEFMPPVKKIGETIGIIYPATEDGSWIKSSIKIILSSNCITSISLYYETKDGRTAVFDCESSTVCTFARRLSCMILHIPQVNQPLSGFIRQHFSVR
jgi:sugar (pentulose or hexulose) kinase